MPFHVLCCSGLVTQCINDNGQPTDQPTNQPAQQIASVGLLEDAAPTHEWTVDVNSIRNGLNKDRSPN